MRATSTLLIALVAGLVGPSAHAQLLPGLGVADVKAALGSGGQIESGVWSVDRQPFVLENGRLMAVEDANALEVIFTPDAAGIAAAKRLFTTPHFAPPEQRKLQELLAGPVTPTAVVGRYRVLVSGTGSKTEVLPRNWIRVTLRPAADRLDLPAARDHPDSRTRDGYLTRSRYAKANAIVATMLAGKFNEEESTARIAAFDAAASQAGMTSSATLTELEYWAARTKRAGRGPEAAFADAVLILTTRSLARQVESDRWRRVWNWVDYADCRMAAGSGPADPQLAALAALLGNKRVSKEADAALALLAGRPTLHDKKPFKLKEGMSRMGWYWIGEGRRVTTDDDDVVDEVTLSGGAKDGYKGVLPLDLAFGDDPAAVARKLGSAGKQAHMDWMGAADLPLAENFDYPALHVSVRYESPTGPPRVAHRLVAVTLKRSFRAAPDGPPAPPEGGPLDMTPGQWSARHARESLKWIPPTADAAVVGARVVTLLTPERLAGICEAAGIAPREVRAASLTLNPDAVPVHAILRDGGRQLELIYDMGKGKATAERVDAYNIQPGRLHRAVLRGDGGAALIGRLDLAGGVTGRAVGRFVCDFADSRSDFIKIITD